MFCHLVMFLGLPRWLKSLLAGKCWDSPTSSPRYVLDSGQRNLVYRHFYTFLVYVKKQFLCLVVTARLQLCARLGKVAAKDVTVLVTGKEKDPEPRTVSFRVHLEAKWLLLALLQGSSCPTQVCVDKPGAHIYIYNAYNYCMPDLCT